ncbi:hypothetical protein [Liquorilactobacillus hordei]|uniref:Uncharacterized protein n=1 Tax=Liquorilactobacillus hordei TaxID=468911 RepID=A0A3Q8CX26_9LACO|nr:hypothetical protein [Liquorilactobacillus hordei]AUJ29096.1 hypothetical protein BSQ49_02050 [Liquorilactobacillus hordei]
MKPKTYPSKRTRSQHTYAFYKERRDDPAWREDYLRVRAIRQRALIIEVMLGILVIAIGVFIVKESQKQSTNNHIVDSTSSIQATTQSSSSSKSHVSTSTASSIKQSTTITNYSRYNKYSGKYIGYANSYTLDFKKGTLVAGDSSQAQVYYFKQVILHPDGSLVINVHNSVSKSSPSYLSVLLAPANKKITKNWQTETSLDDNTDDSTNRLSLATSNDNGKTYNMSPAYKAFSENSTSGSSSSSSYSTIFATTN